MAPLITPEELKAALAARQARDQTKKATYPLAPSQKRKERPPPSSEGSFVQDTETPSETPKENRPQKNSKNSDQSFMVRRKGKESVSSLGPYSFGFPMVDGNLGSESLFSKEFQHPNLIDQLGSQEERSLLRSVEPQALCRMPQFLGMQLALVGRELEKLVVATKKEHSKMSTEREEQRPLASELLVENFEALKKHVQEKDRLLELEIKNKQELSQKLDAAKAELEKQQMKVSELLNIVVHNEIRKKSMAKAVKVCREDLVVEAADHHFTGFKKAVHQIQAVYPDLDMSMVDVEKEPEEFGWVPSGGEE